MATGDFTFFNSMKKDTLDNNIDFLADTMKAAMVTGLTPNIDTHTVWDDLDGNEESGTGYTAGGETLASKTTTIDNTNDRVDIDAADLTWVGLDVGTPDWLIIYKDSGSPATSPLWAMIELGVASDGSDYTVAWAAAAMARLT